MPLVYRLPILAQLSKVKGWTDAKSSLSAASMAWPFLVMLAVFQLQSKRGRILTYSHLEYWM